MNAESESEHSAIFTCEHWRVAPPFDWAQAKRASQPLQGAAKVILYLD
jgi:hypothetical protein